MTTLLLALLSVGLSVAAQFALKAGMARAMIVHPDFSLSLKSVAGVIGQPLVIAGFGLYGLGAVVWLLVLAKWDVSKAYPLVGIGFVATLFIGYFLGEQLSVSRCLGVLLICLGVVLVGRS